MENQIVFVQGKKAHDRTTKLIRKWRKIAISKLKSIALIKQNIIVNIKLIVEKLMQKKEARAHFEWLPKELGVLSKSGEVVIKKMCEYFYQYCKHLCLLDSMRWKMLFQQR